MNKQTKTILGVAAVGVAAYFIYNSMKPKTTASFVKRKKRTISTSDLSDYNQGYGDLEGIADEYGILPKRVRRRIRRSNQSSTNY